MVSAGTSRFEGVNGVAMVVRDLKNVIYASAKYNHPTLVDEKVKLHAGDMVVFEATAEGVVALRTTAGLTMATEDEAGLLGGDYKQRCVFEIELPWNSGLLGRVVSAAELRAYHHCAFLAVRARERPLASPKEDKAQPCCRVPEAPCLVQEPLHTVAPPPLKQQQQDEPERQLGIQLPGAESAADETCSNWSADGDRVEGFVRTASEPEACWVCWVGNHVQIRPGAEEGGTELGGERGSWREEGRRGGGAGGASVLPLRPEARGRSRGEESGDRRKREERQRRREERRLRREDRRRRRQERREVPQAAALEEPPPAQKAEGGAPEELTMAEASSWLKRWSALDRHLPDVVSAEVAVKSFDGFNLCEGDILLAEADAREVNSEAWARDFGLVRKVPNSTPPPPKITSPGKKACTSAVLGGIAATILLFVGSNFTDALASFTLTNNLVVFLVLLIIAGHLPVEEGLRTMDVGVLLTIVGAFPLGDGLAAVGLDTWTASALVAAAAPLGQYAIMVAMYLVCCGLSNLISNIAVIAIVSPIAMSIAELQQISPRSMVLVSVLASSAVFSCPIGHQTNLMVVPLGNYSWGDFFKFGASYQLIHLLICCWICMFM